MVSEIEQMIVIPVIEIATFTHPPKAIVWTTLGDQTGRMLVI